MTNSKQKLAQELDGAYWLDDSLYSKSLKLDSLVDKYSDLLLQGKKRKRPDIYRPQLLILFCNLVKANNRANKWLYRSFGSDAFRKSRYSNGLTKAVFIDGIIDGLESLGFLEIHKGYQDLIKRRASRLRAKGSLLDDLSTISSDDIKINFKDRESIIVSNNISLGFSVLTQRVEKRKDLIDYEDTKTTIEMRKNLQTINQKLDETFIGVWLTDQELEECEPIDFDFKYLVRIFNDESFKTGGRFYRGWWQSIKSKDRAYITINHSVTTELDYKHLHPALLYAREGISKISDAYSLEEISPEYRNDIKQAFQILINCNSKKDALSTIRKYIPTKAMGTTPKILLDLLENKHKPISHFFYTGEGLKLQELDSRIAAYCMLNMIKRHKSIVLPVHDSAIVQIDMVKALKEIMIEAYTIFTGLEPNIDEKIFTEYDPKKVLSNDNLDSYRKYKYEQDRWLKSQVKRDNRPFEAPNVFEPW